MARNRPILVVRSLTEPIIVGKRRGPRADDDADDGEAEAAELVHGVEAALDRLTDRSHLRLRQGGCELADHLVDRLARVGGRDLDEGEFAGPPEQALHGGQVGDEQVVVLPARGPQDAVTVKWSPRMRR